jgi:hypothetical protein
MASISVMGTSLGDVLVMGYVVLPVGILFNAPENAYPATNGVKGRAAETRFSPTLRSPQPWSLCRF